MTGDTHAITRDEQERFRQRTVYPVWLYRMNGRVVGFGLVKRMADGHNYVTLAVSPQHRGKGYGTTIYADLAQLWRGEVYARIRSDNTASIRAAITAGFTTIESGAEVLLKA